MRKPVRCQGLPQERKVKTSKPANASTAPHRCDQPQNGSLTCQRAAIQNLLPAPGTFCTRHRHYAPAGGFWRCPNEFVLSSVTENRPKRSDERSGRERLRLGSSFSIRPLPVISAEG